MQLEERAVLDHVGVPARVGTWHNLSPAELYEHAIRNGEASLVASGALTAETGRHTGRSPKDKFFVEEPGSADKIWWFPGNQPIAPESFDRLLQKMVEYISEHQVYVQDLFACADPNYRLNVRVVTQFAWHSVFAHNLFIRPGLEQRANFEPDFTVISLPDVKADPARDGTRTETFILVNFARRMVLIGGTRYAGEIKKSIFTALNYLMPERGAMPMHCSANIGRDGDVALFFGLSGTGKTTLSSDPTRRLIGDDEQGLERRRHLQLRGGVLREDHPDLARSGAGDLRRHEPFRSHPGERPLRPRHPDTRFRRREPHREHAFRLSHRLHPGRRAERPWRPPEQRALPVSGRIRRAAGSGPPGRGAAALLLPLRLHGQGGRDRAGSNRAGADFQHLLRRTFPRAPC